MQSSNLRLHCIYINQKYLDEKIKERSEITSQPGCFKHPPQFTDFSSSTHRTCEMIWFNCSQSDHVLVIQLVVFTVLAMSLRCLISEVIMSSVITKQK